MNNQKVYNIVRDHLITQGSKCIGMGRHGSDLCLYRGPEGRKCAIGVLIPDEIYESTMEDFGSVSVLLRERPEVVRHFRHEFDFHDSIYSRSIGETSFLVSLQLIHDRNEPSEWPRLLYEFAVEHELQP